MKKHKSTNPSRIFIKFNGNNNNDDYDDDDGGRLLSIQQIYDNLITSMDIAFRYFIDETTSNDKNNKLYEISISLYKNKQGLPDGSALYGIVKHSFDLAVHGYGDKRNQKGDGENLFIKNVHIHDLKLGINEVPAIYFNKCNTARSKVKTPLKGPFGELIDVRKMVGIRNKNVIDLGEDYTQLQYYGNPLSDAQIALGIIMSIFYLFLLPNLKRYVWALAY